jgi:hypothetical protein
MKLDDLYFAAIHLQRALTLYSEARRDDRAARTGVGRIATLAKVALEAHVAGDAVRVQAALGNLVAIAVANFEQQSNATSRYQEIAAAVASMRERIGVAQTRRAH